ncbi:uncharacterized protein LOC126660126 [Mercurialis annua]|uniref:uncharacterized protein LOC126660126 n=1 Tax=Mercurialis annua TaxID=3986 RepID=UPI002160EDBC|nr:uncharacterized protein LOC126660126 [Mercurialis annua]
MTNNQGHYDSVPTKPNTTVDNEGSVHGHAVEEPPRQEPKESVFDDSSDTDEEDAFDESSDTDEEDAFDDSSDTDEEDADAWFGRFDAWFGEFLKESCFRTLRAYLAVKAFEDGRATACIEAVNAAIERENEKEGANLELVQVTKAKARSTIYYVTFLAKNKTTGDIDTYRLKAGGEFGLSKPVLRFLHPGVTEIIKIA